MKPETAMILAAGFGMRMRPLTESLPKPLVRVAGKPLIDYTLDFLAASGISEVVVNSHYLAELLEAHLHARLVPPHILISREEVALETGGGVKNALKLLGNSPFFVLNSDVICIDGTTPALERLWKYWDDTKMDALLLLHKVKDAVGYEGKGDFSIFGEGKLRRRPVDETAPLVFTGIQILSPRLFANSPEGAFSLNALYNQSLDRVHALVHDGAWLHIGDEKGLAQAENWLLENNIAP